MAYIPINVFTVFSTILFISCFIYKKSKNGFINEKLWDELALKYINDEVSGSKSHLYSFEKHLFKATNAENAIKIKSSTNVGQPTRDSSRFAKKKVKIKKMDLKDWNQGTILAPAAVPDSVTYDRQETTSKNTKNPLENELQFTIDKLKEDVYQLHESLYRLTIKQSKLENDHKVLKENQNALKILNSILQETCTEYQQQLLQCQAKLQEYDLKSNSIENILYQKEVLFKDKLILMNRISYLQEQLSQQNQLFESKSNEWTNHIQYLQETNSNQILRINSDMDIMKRLWKSKMDRLESELQREKYERYLLLGSITVKQIEYEKLQREAFYS